MCWPRDQPRRGWWRKVRRRRGARDHGGLCHRVRLSSTVISLLRRARRLSSSSGAMLRKRSLLASVPEDCNGMPRVGKEHAVSPQAMIAKARPLGAADTARFETCDRRVPASRTLRNNGPETTLHAVIGPGGRTAPAATSTLSGHTVATPRGRGCNQRHPDPIVCGRRHRHVTLCTGVAATPALRRRAGGSGSGQVAAGAAPVRPSRTISGTHRASAARKNA